MSHVHTRILPAAASALSNFPVLITPTDTPEWATFWATVANGGGDIRVYLDDDTTQLARDVVSCDTVAKTGEIWVKVPTISGTLTTSLHIYADGVSGEPAEDSTYGREAVWSTYLFASHDGGLFNSKTSSLMSNSGTTEVSGKIGVGRDFVRSENDSIDISGAALSVPAGTDKTISFWYKQSTTPAGSENRFIFDAQTGRLVCASATLSIGNPGISLFDGSWKTYGSNAFTNGVFQLAHFVFEGTTARLYLDGLNLSDIGYTQKAIGGVVRIGGDFASGNHIDAVLDEFRVCDSALSPAWVAYEYANQSDPSGWSTGLDAIVHVDVTVVPVEVELLEGSVSHGFSTTLPGPLEVELEAGQGAITSGPSGTFSHTIEQRIGGEIGVVRAWITNDIVAYGTFSHTIEQEIGTFGAVSYTIEQQIYEYGTFSASIQQQIYDADDFGGVAAGSHTLWTAVVTLGGVDVSERLTGTVRVEAEEGTSRTAEMTLRPKPNAEKNLVPVVLNSWLRQPVTIDYVTLNDDGSTRSQVRIFTGKVDEPVYDPITRLVTFNCTDTMITELENMERDTIDALTPGARWTDLVFSEDVDNYEYARDRMSTIPYALDKDKTGSYHWTPWAAKVTPDFIFESGDIIDESLAVDIQPGRELVNSIDIDFGYRFDRKRQRKAKFDWNFPSNFCEYLGVGLTGTWTLPSVQMIQDAAEGTGWCLESMVTQKLPPSQWVNCGNQLTSWVVSATQRDNLALRAQGTLVKRFLQSISEKYLLTVQAPISFAAYGVLKDKMVQNVVATADLSPWEDDLECCEPQINQQSVGGGGTDAWETWEDVDTAPLVASGSRGDMEYAIETLVAQARNQILDSHRQNRVSFDVPLHPMIDRHQTVEIDTETVDARGKVFHVLHVMDLTAGVALTSVQLAISISGEGVVSDTPIAAPEKPDTTERLALLSGTQNLIPTTTHYGGIAFDTGATRIPLNTISVPDPSYPLSDDLPATSIGGNTQSPVGGDVPDGLCLGEVSDPWIGYVGNKVPADAGSIEYASRFVLSTEAIEEDDRLEEEAEAGHEYDVAVPNDFLTLAA